MENCFSSRQILPTWGGTGLPAHSARCGQEEPRRVCEQASSRSRAPSGGDHTLPATQLINRAPPNTSPTSPPRSPSPMVHGSMEDRYGALVFFLSLSALPKPWRREVCRPTQPWDVVSNQQGGGDHPQTPPDGGWGLGGVAAGLEIGPVIAWAPAACPSAAALAGRRGE